MMWPFKKPEPDECRDKASKAVEAAEKESQDARAELRKRREALSDLLKGVVDG